MKEKSIKGITLVALVITIVILLILAGISIQAITNTGLFSNAKRATEESKYANAAEKVALAVNTSYDSTGKINDEYLKENVNVLKAVAKSPYVVGCDFIGEEINDISDLQPAITEIVKYVEKEDRDFTIRIHAGENDSLRDNVRKSILCIKEALQEGEQMPRCRIGHGLYSVDLGSKAGHELMELMEKNGVVIEFQLTSNVRLNNLSDLSNHPLKTFLKNGVKCVQGTDGCGFYGSDTIDEQLALQNLLGLTEKEFSKMRETEKEIIEHSQKYFKEKSKKFKEFLNGRTIREEILQLEDEIEEESKSNKMKLRLNNNILSEIALKDKIVKLPTDKMPIIIADGSFNARNRDTKVEKNVILSYNYVSKFVIKITKERGKSL